MNRKTEAGRRGTEKQIRPFLLSLFAAAPFPELPPSPSRGRTTGTGRAEQGLDGRSRGPDGTERGEGRAKKGEKKRRYTSGQQQKVGGHGAAGGRAEQQQVRGHGAAVRGRKPRRCRRATAQIGGAEVRGCGAAAGRSNRQRKERQAARRQNPGAAAALFSPLSSLFWRAAGLGAPARGYRRRDFPRAPTP